MKIAIFHCEEIPTLFQLEAAAKKTGFETHLFHFKDIKVFVDNESFDLRVNGTSLKDFSIVFCRGFWDYQNEVSFLVNFCQYAGIPFFDSALKHRQIVSKMYDLISFKLAGLPVPKTIFSEQQSDADIIADQLKFPIVIKEDRSRQGRDVFLIKDEEELKKSLRERIADNKNLASKTYQFQEFIPADFDVRVLVIGGEVIGAIERRSNDPNEFRHNISLGGTATKMNVTPEMKSLALAASNALDYQFAGVDLIAHKHTGKTYLLEVNRSPGFSGFMQATGIDVPAELMKFFLRFLGKEIK